MQRCIQYPNDNKNLVGKFFHSKVRGWFPGYPANATDVVELGGIDLGSRVVEARRVGIRGESEGIGKRAAKKLGQRGNRISAFTLFHRTPEYRW